MKAFRFRLRRLLDIRRVEEREAEAVARAAAAKLAELDLAHESLRREREGLRADYAAAAGRPADLRLALEHEARLDEALRRIEKSRDDARRAATEAEAEARRRRGARRALEELENRARETWSEDARRAETALMDEIAAGRRRAGLAGRGE
jgi:flagellar biosynthesis chaperone FliJ